MADTAQRFVYVADGSETTAGFTVTLPVLRTEPYLVWGEQAANAAEREYWLTFDIPSATLTLADFVVLPSNNLVAGQKIMFYVDTATSSPVEITLFVSSATQIPPEYPSLRPAVLEGDTITINGGGFTGATAVTVNGVSTPFAVVNDTEITLGPVPAHAYGDATVIVTTPGGASEPKTPFIYSHWRTMIPTGLPTRVDGYQLLLDNGKVLVFGGTNNNGDAAADRVCYLFDPVTFAVTPTGSLNIARCGFAAVKLNDGRVLAVGGSTPEYPVGPGPEENCWNNFEYYDPGTGTWTLPEPIGPGDNRNLQYRRGITGTPSRFGLSAFLLNDGTVLIIGGGGAVQVLAGAEPPATTYSEIFDPISNTTGQIATIPSFDGQGDTGGVKLADGDVIAWFGNDTQDAVDGNTFRYDATTNTWSAVASMITPRNGPDMRSVLLPSGSVLTVGGGLTPRLTDITPGNSAATNDVEAYNPGSDTWLARAPIAEAANGVSLVVLSDGKIMRFGGVSGEYTYNYNILTTEVYDEGSNAWTPLDPRQMTNSQNYFFFNGSGDPLQQFKWTQCGQWDPKIVIQLPDDQVFAICGYPYPNGVEQYRPS